MRGQWPYSDVYGIQPTPFNNFQVGTSYWNYAPIQVQFIGQMPNDLDIRMCT